MEEKIETYKYTASVRFDEPKKLYFFGTNDDSIETGSKVVVETVRGMELGEVVGELRDSNENKLSIPIKPIKRKATPKDLSDYERNIKDEKKALATCNDKIQALNLAMQLISAEYTLDRNKIIFSYVAENRVDFRELLKELAGIFHCRIELRQIGSRDKAKIVGGLGTCGMPMCCNRFKEDFDIISINMAKNQLLALNIQKLSGQCGKLMCCLKYEDDCYKELKIGLPKMNSQIVYNNSRYRVTGMNVLNNSAKLSNREETIFITLDELKQVCQKEKADEKTEKLSK